MDKQVANNIFHRFLDEAGDTSFYGKGRKAIIGTKGVSDSFIVGMIHFKEPLESIRKLIVDLQDHIANDPYFDVISIRQKKLTSGYYFHATDDLPEVRKLFLDFINKLDCNFEAVVGRKSVERYETMHKGKEQYFYADMLSHLLKNKLGIADRLVLHIAERGKSTKNANLNLALEKAKERLAHAMNQKTIKDEENVLGIIGKLVSRKDIQANIVFNVTRPVQEPLLTIADYFCWVVQNVFEKGEVRYYNYVKEKISLIVDLYDEEKYEEMKNYYTPNNPLTPENKISPLLH
jgi:hypothetical protein